jgi:asparagine synthase (glutamine-hydrolysing)
VHARQEKLHHRSQRLQVLALRDAYAAFAREAEERSIARQGLELRQPFHNQKVVQFAFSSPERLRSLGRTTKRFHRRAVSDLLPAAVVDRTTKADFMGAFRTDLDDCEGELKKVIARRSGGWLDESVAMTLVHRRTDPDLAGWVEWPLWSLIGCDALVS